MITFVMDISNIRKVLIWSGEGEHYIARTEDLILNVRDYAFDRTEIYLKQQLAGYTNTRLNILLVGPTGAGKSSLINSILSISQGRLVDKATVKSDVESGVGTHRFHELKAGTEKLFQNVYIYDTMGFTPNGENDAMGISNADFKAVLEGQVPNGHMFNLQSVTREPNSGNKPNCVIFVVSAEEMDETKKEPLLKKLRSLYTMVPDDVGRIAVMTKTDLKCEDTNRDIRYIYYSKTVHELVKKVGATLHLQENMVFPVVNFVKQIEVYPEISVPILYALRSAVNSAYDRKETMLL